MYRLNFSNQVFLKLKKKHKKCHSRKLQGFKQHILEAGLTISQSILTAPKYRVAIFNFFELFFNKSFLKIFEITKSSLSRKLKGFVYSLLEPKFATSGGTLRPSHYWVANFKLADTNTLNSLKIRRKILNHCDISYSLSVKISFVKHVKIINWKMLTGREIMRARIWIYNSSIENRLTTH